MEQALFGAGSDDEFIVNAPPTKKKQRSCYQSALSTSARRMIYCTFENANKSEHGRKLSGVSQKQGGVALFPHQMEKSPANPFFSVPR